MRGKTLTIRVILQWDGEAKVWSASSTDLPGLVTEAGSIPDVMQRVMEIAPELIEDNLDFGNSGEELLLSIIPSYQQTMRIPAH